MFMSKLFENYKNTLHKIDVGFKRAFSSKRIKITSEMKRYGNEGEIEIAYDLHKLIDAAEMKFNVLLDTPSGTSEIDILLLYQRKLFAIEVKNWKGRLTESGKNFIQEKDDPYTGETYYKNIKSPFSQIHFQIKLLKEQTSSKVYINPIVFFAASEEVNVDSENVRFDKLQDLVKYIKTDGKQSPYVEITKCFDYVRGADFIFSSSVFGERGLHCRIFEESLKFNIEGKLILKDDIKRIDIKHHLTEDEVTLTLNDDSNRTLFLENHEIKVKEGKEESVYSFSKIETIFIGR